MSDDIFEALRKEVERQAPLKSEITSPGDGDVVLKADQLRTLFARMIWLRDAVIGIGYIIEKMPSSYKNCTVGNYEENRGRLRTLVNLCNSPGGNHEER